MASRLQDVILRGLAAARPLATDVAPGTLYFSTDVATTERCSDSGLTWETYTDSASGGVPGVHATTHEPGGTDPMAVDAVAATGSLRTLGTGANQAAAGNDARFGVVALHASTHSLGATDPVDVTDLAGYPGGGTTFLRDDGTFAAPSASAVRRQVTVIIDGGGVAITTGVKSYLSLPVAGTWKKWRLLSIDAAATAGSIVIDVWKDTYANYPPAVADTIVAASKPTLSAVNKNEDSALTGWTTAFSAGDVLGFNVDSATTVTKVSLTLEFE